MILRLALLIALVAPCCISMELESQGFNLVTDETLDKLKDPAIKTYKKTVTVVNRTYVIGISLDTREVSKITQYLLYKENSKSKVLAFWSLDIKRNAFEAFMTTSKNECDIQFKKAMDGDAILKHGLVKIGDEYIRLHYDGESEDVIFVKNKDNIFSVANKEASSDF